MASYGLSSSWEIPMQLTVGGSLSGLFGPVFLLTPAALLALRNREGRRLLLAAAVFGAGYAGNISARFLIPAAPFLAMALALALARVPRLAVALVIVHGVLSWPDVVKRYCHADAWHLAKVTWREAWRIKPEEGFLVSNLPDYGVDRLLERATKPGSTVFTFTPIPEAYTTRNIRVGYQSAGNVISRVTFYTGFLEEYGPSRRWRFRFARQVLGGVRVIVTNTSDISWSINEINVLNGVDSMPRGAWRVSADPFPWGAGKIMDGSPVTFWLCGDTARPGQSVAVDFRGSAPADAVAVDAAPNQGDIRLRLEGLDGSGRWVDLSRSPEEERLPLPAALRRQAAAELKRRGIDYLLLFDGETGAEELRRNAALWGVRLAGEERKARLYELP